MDVPLRLIALDPGTGGENCPAMLVNDVTGDLSFLGVETDVGERVGGVRVLPGEVVATLPARMRRQLIEALLELEAKEETDGGGFGVVS